MYNLLRAISLHWIICITWSKFVFYCACSAFSWVSWLFYPIKKSVLGSVGWLETFYSGKSHMHLGVIRTVLPMFASRLSSCPLCWLGFFQPQGMAWGFVCCYCNAIFFSWVRILVSWLLYACPALLDDFGDGVFVPMCDPWTFVDVHRRKNIDPSLSK